MAQTEPPATPRSRSCDLELRYDLEAGEYQFDHDWDGDTSVGSKIVLALERITDTDVHDLDRLHETVDPEALDDLFRPQPDGSPRDTGLVSFTYAGYVVTVNATGRIEIARV